MNQTELTIRQALEQAVAETFMGMAFLDAIPAEAPHENNEAQVFAIQVRGEQVHRLVLDLSLETKRTIVENIHGTSWDELASNDVDDCLLEFLNVLGGAFGRLYWGDESRYKLSFPEIRIGIPDELDTSPIETYWFNAYEQFFAVHVITEE
ncbi:MAG: hypothetical protein ACOC2Y_05270 [Spirochaetota bacterium]